MPLRPLILCLALAAAVAGCGSSGSSSSSGGGASSGGGYGAPAPAASKPASSSGQTVKLSADPSGALSFTTSKLKAKAGTVTLKMTNASSVGHSIAIEGNGVDKDSSSGPVSQGQTSSVTATLKPGTYTFYCPVDGHRQAGMHGTLVVT